MSEARINRISNELGTGGPIVSGITTFSNVNYFVPPRGTTAERPSNCPPGSIRFNTDGAHLEYFDGLQWLEMEAFNNEIGQAGALGNRGVFGGGATPTIVNTIEYITISTLGNALDFGDLNGGLLTAQGGCASSTRGLFQGGFTGTATNRIDYITISSTGNAADFGDLTQARFYGAGCSNSTRGLCIGGSTPTTVNTIDYVTIASNGTNAQDFGDLTSVRTNMGACSSTTRAVFAGGYTNIIEFLTIQTLGNSTDFGDLPFVRGYVFACSNATRGLFAGGGNPSPLAAITNIIDYVTIASTGNAQDFGDLTVARRLAAAASSSTRGVFAGGDNVAPTVYNTIDYVTILTTGNAIDFGDTLTTLDQTTGLSNGHGGL
jgi:hypothetical protein